MSEAGSLLSESMDSAGRAAAEMMRLPLRCAGIGAACILAPVFALLLAPLVLLLTPLLLPIGLVLVVVGLGRAGLIATLSEPVTLELRDAPDAALGAPRSAPEMLTSIVPPPVRQGTMSELNQLAGARAEHLVKQVGHVVRHNLSKATKEVSGEVGEHLHALQLELQSWAGANPNLKPYCHGHIGWLLRLEQLEGGAHGAHGDRHTELAGVEAGVGAADGSRARASSWNVRQRADLDLSRSFEKLFEALPPPNVALTPATLAAVPLPSNLSWEGLGFLLVPGLLTKWYPLYMKQLRGDMKRLGLVAAFSRVDTDQPVRINAARLRHEILEMSADGRKVVLLGHSKGAVDSAAALSLFPELCSVVAGLVSLQGPHAGSAIAHDLSNTQLQKTVVLGALEKLLRGCKHAVLDLSFESRQEFLRQHTYPAHRVPTLCVATCDRRQSSLLTPLIEYVAVRYGEVCDGLVCQCDAVLPNCKRVIIDDMDHFGPAWGSFPATDRYDPTRLWLTCVSLALRFGLVAEDPGLRRETASSSAAMATAPTAAATMPTGVVA